MKHLEYTLLVKITLTALLWCLPLVCFPPSLFELLGFTDTGPLIFLRLLGIAYLALLAGYAMAYRATGSGTYPATTVLVGFVSNGGAFLCLVWGAVSEQWSGWGWLAQAYMWVSLLATGSITLALYRFGLSRHGWQAP